VAEDLQMGGGSAELAIEAAISTMTFNPAFATHVFGVARRAANRRLSRRALQALSAIGCDARDISAPLIARRARTQESCSGGKLLLSLILCSASTMFAQLPTEMSYTYTLPNDSSRSVGVYDSAGALIRTIVSGNVEKAGTFVKTWDGLTDAGVSASNPPYTIRLLDSTVSYIWDGAIGDTGQSWVGGGNRWSIFGTNGPNNVRMAFVGSRGYIATGYSEASFNLGYIDAQNPNSPQLISPHYLDQMILVNAIATDGAKVYLANMGQAWGGPSYVTVLEGVSGQPSTFTGGIPLTATDSNQHNGGFVGLTLSTIDNGAPNVSYPTGIAVQPTGNILAVAHGVWRDSSGVYTPSNVIHLFDKITGLQKGNDITTVTNPTAMAFDAAGNLWIISNGALVEITNVGLTNDLSTPIAGLANAVFVATNKVTGHVFVLDGGSHQQLKEYDTSYALVRTYGDLGGYTDNNPSITNTRLMLDSTATTGTAGSTGSWVAVQDDNSVWLCDGGTGPAGRILHISPANTYVNQIMYGPLTYSIAVSHTLPTRLFSYNWEYTINYSVPNLPGDPDVALGGNGSWKLTKNWLVGVGSLPIGQFKNIQFGPELLSNGRAYGQVKKDLNIYEVEFPLSGTVPLRPTGMSDLFNRSFLERNGNLGTTWIGGNPNVTTTYLSTLTGFDKVGNPLRTGPKWGSGAWTIPAQVTNAGIDTVEGRGGWGMYQDWTPSAAGVYIAYQTNPTGTIGFPHLAGMVAGRSSYLWHAMPEKNLTQPDYQGGFPSVAGYGGHAGTSVVAEGHNIIAFYDGQYAANGEVFCHFWDDGLFVGEFGKLGPEVPLSIAQWGNAYATAPIGDSGNVVQALAVTVNGIVYVYNPSEGGEKIQRWHFDPSRVHEYQGTGAIGASVVLTEIPAGGRFTASYAAQGNYTASTSASISTSSAVSTNVSLSVLPLSLTQGESITLNAVVTPASGTTMPTGSVTFYNGNTQVGVASLSGGSASANITNLPVGTAYLTAFYPANGAFSNSTSQAITIAVTAAPNSTTTALSASPTNQTQGGAVTLTATVSSASGIIGSSGSVTFYDGTAQIGNSTVTNGSATITTTTLPIGTNTLTASFSGDAVTLASTSKPISVTIVLPLAPDFIMTVSPSVLVVMGGESTNTVLTIEPQNGFSQSLSLMCSGLPSGSSCTFGTPATQAKGTTTIALVINTQKHAGSLQDLPLKTPVYAVLVLAGMLSFRLKKTSDRLLCSSVISLALLAVLAATTGCGGGNVLQSATSTPSPNPITSTVAVTAQTQGGLVGHTTYLTLTVN
jgi:hypothetical protein